MASVGLFSLSGCNSRLHSPFKESQTMKPVHSPFPDSKFPLGRILATPGALEVLGECGQQASEFFSRHAAGDWGDIHPEDIGLNEQALLHGSRLMSVYQTNDGTKVWLITEADRSATTLLLPEEY
jgi:hypothetical protein